MPRATSSWEAQTSGLCPTKVRQGFSSRTWRALGLWPEPCGEIGACRSGLCSLRSRLCKDKEKTECSVQHSVLQMTHLLPKEICQAYENPNWIHRAGNVHSLGELGVKDTAYSSLPWVVPNTHWVVLWYLFSYNKKSYDITTKSVAYFCTLPIASLILVRITYTWILHHLLVNELISRCQGRRFCPVRWSVLKMFKIVILLKHVATVLGECSAPC